MLPDRPITPSTLSLKDLPWQILWDKDRCTLCGRCTAVCPVNAISGERKELHVIDEEICTRCGVCYNVCKFDAIEEV